MAILAGQRIRALDFAGYASGFEGTNITSGLYGDANAWLVPTPIFGVSFMAPSSGAVKCDFGGRLNVPTAAGIGQFACELRTGNVIGSGVVVEAASLERAVEVGDGQTGSARLGASMFRIHTGLAPGALYHFVWQCGVQISTTSTDPSLGVYARTITVTPWNE